MEREREREVYTYIVDQEERGNGSNGAMRGMETWGEREWNNRGKRKGRAQKASD